jgi:hypothetical protein
MIILNLNTREDSLRGFYGKTLYVKPFWDQFESKRKNPKKREEEKCLHQGMNQCPTPLTAVKPLRFP